MAGMSARVVMTATVAASVALSQSVHKVGFVNQLSKDVSMTLETQEDTDVKMKDKLNALCDVVQSLGDELQSLKTRVQLKCHADYEWVCVTSSVCNESVIG